MRKTMKELILTVVIGSIHGSVYGFIMQLFDIKFRYGYVISSLIIVTFYLIRSLQKIEKN